MSKTRALIWRKPACCAHISLPRGAGVQTRNNSVAETVFQVVGEGTQVAVAAS